MEPIVLVIAGILMGAGLVGCVLPVLPGPPLSFLGLLLQWWAAGWEAESYGWITVLVLAVLAALVTALDFIAPVYGAKRYGASKAGLWGSIVGLLIGMIFFPPFGMILGAFLGALGGEWMVGKSDREAMRAAWGVFMGTMVGIVLKLTVSVAILVVFLIELFS